MISKNTLIQSQSLMMEVNTKEISDYISELSDSDALKRSRTYCRNAIFNAILSRYAEICESERISFAADIR